MLVFMILLIWVNDANACVATIATTTKVPSIVSGIPLTPSTSGATTDNTGNTESTVTTIAVDTTSVATTPITTVAPGSPACRFCTTANVRRTADCQATRTCDDPDYEVSMVNGCAQLTATCKNDVITPEVFLVFIDFKALIQPIPYDINTFDFSRIKCNDGQYTVRVDSIDFVLYGLRCAGVPV